MLKIIKQMMENEIKLQNSDFSQTFEMLYVLMVPQKLLGQI